MAISCLGKIVGSQPPPSALNAATAARAWLDALPEPKLSSPMKDGLRACLERVAQELVGQSNHPASHALTQIALRSNRILQERWRHRYVPYQNYLEEVLSRSVRCPDSKQAAIQFLLLAVGSIDWSSLMAVSEPRLAAVELFIGAYA